MCVHYTQACTLTAGSSVCGRSGSRRHGGIGKPVRDRRHRAQVGEWGRHCQRAGAPWGRCRAHPLTGALPRHKIYNIKTVDLHYNTV